MTRGSAFEGLLKLQDMAGTIAPWSQQLVLVRG
jgi:hypothetical protein